MKEWLGAKSIVDTADFYDEKYKHSGKGAFTGYNFDFFFKHLENLFGKIRPTESIIDFGCGHGEFLETIISRYKHSCPHLAGVDISEEAFDLATNRFKNYEFRVSIFNDDIQNVRIKHTFEVATCWGSIEHTLDPKDALMNIFNHVKPGGYVFITVPLEFDGCLTAIENEHNKKNNERFMTSEEWCLYFSSVKKPILTESVPYPDFNDLLLIFKK